MDVSPSCAVPRLSNVTALPRRRKGDDGVEESSRDDAPTDHLLDRGAADQDVSPHVDDLRPLYLQEPTERGRTFESVGDLEPPPFSEILLSAFRPKRTEQGCLFSGRIELTSDL